MACTGRAWLPSSIWCKSQLGREWHHRLQLDNSGSPHIRRSCSWLCNDIQLDKEGTSFGPCEADTFQKHKEYGFWHLQRQQDKPNPLDRGQQLDERWLSLSRRNIQQHKHQWAQQDQQSHSRPQRGKEDKTLAYQLDTPDCRYQDDMRLAIQHQLDSRSQACSGFLHGFRHSWALPLLLLICNSNRQRKESQRREGQALGKPCLEDMAQDGLSLLGNSILQRNGLRPSFQQVQGRKSQALLWCFHLCRSSPWHRDQRPCSIQIYHSMTQDRKEDRHPWHLEEVDNSLLDMGLLSLKESSPDRNDPQDMDPIAHQPHTESLPSSSSSRQGTQGSLPGTLGSGMFLQDKESQQGFRLGTSVLERSHFRRVETALSQQHRNNRHRRAQQVQPGQLRGNTFPRCTFRRCSCPSPW